MLDDRTNSGEALLGIETVLILLEPVQALGTNSGEALLGIETLSLLQEQFDICWHQFR